MRSLPHDVTLTILEYLGVQPLRRGDDAERVARHAASTCGCPVSRVRSVSLPWQPRARLEGDWLVPLPRERVESVHGNRGRVLWRTAAGRVSGGDARAQLATKLGASDGLVVALFADGRAQVWVEPAAPAALACEGVLDFAFGEASVLFLHAEEARLHLLDGARVSSSRLPGSFASVSSYRRGALDHGTHYALECGSGFLYEVSPPSPICSRMAWQTPLGGCGAQQALPSLDLWSLARRPSRGRGLRDLGCGYAHLGPSAGAVLSFPTILSGAPGALKEHFSVGCVDLACVTSRATTAHFHALLLLFRADGSADVWTWCMHWHWVHQRRLSLATEASVVAPTRYAALHTGAAEWTVLDAERAHSERQFATAHAGEQVAFVRCGPADDDYALFLRRDGRAQLVGPPHCSESCWASARELYSGFEGPCRLLRSGGGFGVARVTEEGVAHVRVGAKAFHSDNAADVLFSADGRFFATSPALV